MRILKPVLFLVILLSSSCSSVNKSHLSSSINLSVESNMSAKIDVDMSRKLVGYASGGYLLHLFRVSGDNKYADGIQYTTKPGMFSSLSRVEKVKAAAAYNAVRTSEVDVLVSPQYVVEESHWNPFYKSVKVKVTGFPGKIISIRNNE